MQDTIKKSLVNQDCCLREMTVVERLEFRRSNIIEELAAIEDAIEELKCQSISNATARILTKLG